jgi:hypothetical protein
MSVRLCWKQPEDWRGIRTVAIYNDEDTIHFSGFVLIRQKSFKSTKTVLLLKVGKDQGFILRKSSMKWKDKIDDVK